MCRDADVAGSIDLIAWDTRRKVYHIIDFKRSDKLRSQMRGYGKMATFTHLDACKGAGYALQTSIYQRVLERDYGMAFGDRVLLSVHADAPFATSVPYLENEVDFILNTRIELTRARRAVAAGDASLRCAHTSAPAVDAVRLGDGRVVMENAARVLDVPYEPAHDVRERFERAVAAEVRPVDPFVVAACTSWRRQMPEDGIPPFSRLD